jgi:DNA polymerase III sliding clamp (beta) subunit (PCNA family)
MKTINRIDFLNVLQNLSPALVRGMNKLSNHFIFDDNKIMAISDEIQNLEIFDHGITHAAIDGKNFIQIISKLKDDEITINQNKASITIKAGSFSANIKILADFTMPVLSSPEEWIDLPDGFIEAINFTAGSALKDENVDVPGLSHILIDNIDDGNGYAVAMTGFRGTKFKLNSRVETSFMVPASMVKFIVNYNVIKYNVDDNWLHLSNDRGSIFSFRLLASDYPKNVLIYFNVDGNKINLPTGYYDVIERVQTIVTAEFDQDKFVKLIFSQGQVECIGMGQLGDIQETREFDYDGPDIEILIHPVPLVEILKHSSEFVLGENRIKFETDKFQHFICLSK